MIKPHSFHIPVMGIGFTIDTPLKVAHYGIDSVISLVDDILIEKMRKFHCSANQLPYQEITNKEDDFRAKRITSYLNLLQNLVEKKYEELKFAAAEKSDEIKKYFNFLPDGNAVKQEFLALTQKHFNLDEIRNWVSEKLAMGGIDVNIMTKVDKDNYTKEGKLPIEYNDAHAALRGFAKSDLRSNLILSAGMNPRLYSYLEHFEDFYPDETGAIKKKIILKVSDYRSAYIQGKILAKKGIWISEYRIESGLNCGGHAFATDGNLMGPILAEFRDKRFELAEELHDMLAKALEAKNKPVPHSLLPIKITAQGGVGTAEEHQFLLDHYKVDSVGWGTPFLLVPEVVNVDEPTLNQMKAAKEDDLFLSDISPLGVPFNSLRGNTKDEEKLRLIEKGRPGSSCPKRFVALNQEFNEKGTCTASREYQHLKLKQLEDANYTTEEYQKQFNKIVVKSCTCVGLGTSALLVNKLSTKVEGKGVSICPGPNMAYFDKVMKLGELTDHIYGRANVISRTDRPNMFVKELQIYLDFLKNKFEETKNDLSKKQEKYLTTFSANLADGIAYYHSVFSDLKLKAEDKKQALLNELNDHKQYLEGLRSEIERRFAILETSLV